MTSTERAVRKAGRERLLADFTQAAYTVERLQDEWAHYYAPQKPAEDALWLAQHETSRTRYACLMTAFGQ